MGKNRRTEIRDNLMVPQLLLLILLVLGLSNASPTPNPTPDPDLHIHLHGLDDATSTTTSRDYGNGYQDERFYRWDNWDDQQQGVEHGLDYNWWDGLMVCQTCNQDSDKRI